METVRIEGKDYEVIGHADDGLPVIRGIATTTQDGFDEHGNPRVSVNVNVPAVVIGATVGEQG